MTYPQPLARQRSKTNTIIYWLLVPTVTYMVLFTSLLLWCTYFRTNPPKNLVYPSRALDTALVTAEIDVTKYMPAFQATTAKLPPETTIELSGPGGNIAVAHDVANYIHAHVPNPVIIPDDTLCASACAILYAAFTNRHLAPHGYLGFHATVITPDTRYDDCLECNLLNRIRGKPRTAMPTNDHDRHLGQEWAQAISPALATFLESCKPYPLDSLDGLVISGTELDQIEAGTLECSTIRNHTLPWLHQQIPMRLDPIL